MKKRIGLVGYPIGHSLSPVIYDYWVKLHGIKNVSPYELCEVKPDDFDDFMRTNDFYALNITMPYKDRVRSGEIINLECGYRGHNTDVNAIRQHVVQWINPLRPYVFILGCGAMAENIIHCLLEQQFHIYESRIDTHIKIIARDEVKGLALVNKYHNSSITYSEWAKRNDILDDASMLINATPLGMKGFDDLDISLKQLPKDATVCDMIYNPLKTTLLKTAKKRGNTIVDGLTIFMSQAQYAFNIMFGIKPEITPELRKLLERELRC